MTKSLTAFEDGNLTLAARVQERLREAILTDTLKAGSRIDQNQIAEALRVSLAPVREAMKGLEAEGLVTILPRRGAFVSDVSVDDMDDLYVARAMVEGEAIFHAVLRLTDDDFSNLQRIIERMVQVTKAGDISGYIALNRDFHLHIYDALDNPYILQVIHNLWKRSELYRYRYMYVSHDHERVHREHQHILDLCRRRDQSGSREAAVMHIQGTQHELHEQLRMATPKSSEMSLADLSLTPKDA